MSVPNLDAGHAVTYGYEADTGRMDAVFWSVGLLFSTGGLPSHHYLYDANGDVGQLVDAATESAVFTTGTGLAVVFDGSYSDPETRWNLMLQSSSKYRHVQQPVFRKLGPQSSSLAAAIRDRVGLLQC